MPRRERWPPPAAISPRGIWAGLTTGACLVVAGLAHAFGSWNELTTCSGISVGTGPAGAGAQEVCDLVGAVGGLWFMMAAGVAVLGVVVLWTVRARPTAPTGGSGWTWGWGALTAIGGVVLVTRLSNYSCPDGSVLDEAFALCIGPGSDRAAATSHLALKGLLAVVPLIAGVMFARARWIPASLATGLTALVWFAAMGWLLFDTVGGDLFPG